MFKYLKTNIALLICLVFISRLLFINISLLSVSGTQQANGMLAKYFSSTQKRKHSTEIVVRDNAIDYSDVEVCEEDSDDDEKGLMKVNSPVILSISTSFLDYATFTPKTNSAFDLIKSDLYSKKYLALSILRI